MALATELGKLEIEEVWHYTHPGINLYGVESSAEAEQHKEGVLLLADYAEKIPTFMKYLSANSPRNEGELGE